MRRFFNPFVLMLTGILLLGYTYMALSLTHKFWLRSLLALPFLCVWLIPIVYWIGKREGHRRFDHMLHYAGYLAMGWLSFILVLTVLKDLAWSITAWVKLDALHLWLGVYGGSLALLLSWFGLIIGAITAIRGPSVLEVSVPIANLPEALQDLRIVQISDLHVGPTIKRPYVERIVAMTNDLAADLVVLTGDIVDGSLKKLVNDVQPLARLRPTGQVYFIVGNHEYYSGIEEWNEYFAQLGMRVLLNDADVWHKGEAQVLIAGVLDPAARMRGRSLSPAGIAAGLGDGPDPVKAAQAAGIEAATKVLRILLAHNPQIAPAAAAAGYDLQLSGHTHAGQFHPWTWVTRMVHRTHFAGLSREGNMWVYVSAGTGTWGPPVRFGTKPELTLIKLVRA